MQQSAPCPAGELALHVIDYLGSQKGSQYTSGKGTRVCFHDAKPGPEEEELKSQDDKGL